MILGRPTSLWIGLVAAMVGAGQVIAVALGADAAQTAIIGGALGTVAGSAIALIAGQPPTLAPGDAYKIATPPGTPNYEATVATPPAPTKPVVEDNP